ncbi:hypothetical protein V8C86DRAFT_840062 [Haematococcus lacustris]
MMARPAPLPFLSLLCPTLTHGPSLGLTLPRPASAPYPLAQPAFAPLRTGQQLPPLEPPALMELILVMTPLEVSGRAPFSCTLPALHAAQPCRMLPSHAACCPAMPGLSLELDLELREEHCSPAKPSLAHPFPAAQLVAGWGKWCHSHEWRIMLGACTLHMTWQAGS